MKNSDAIIICNILKPELKSVKVKCIAYRNYMRVWEVIADNFKNRLYVDISYDSAWFLNEDKVIELHSQPELKHLYA